MKFPFKKSKNIFSLMIGVLWLILFIADVVLDEKWNWFTCFKLILALSYILLFFFNRNQKYFEITDEHIKMPSIPVKEIKIKDITEIKKVFDEYEIKSEKTKIKISTQSLDKDYKDLFEEKIEEIRLQLNPNS